MTYTIHEAREACAAAASELNRSVEDPESTFKERYQNLGNLMLACSAELHLHNPRLDYEELRNNIIAAIVVMGGEPDKAGRMADACTSRKTARHIWSLSHITDGDKVPGYKKRRKSIEIDIDTFIKSMARQQTAG